MLVQTHESPDVEELRLLGDEIATLAAHIEVAHRAAAGDDPRVRRLAHDGRPGFARLRCGWGNGFQSCAHWLNYRVGMDLGAARQRVRVAHALPRLPQIADAFARGRLSYAKVRALTGGDARDQERLLTFALHGTASHVERLVSAWRRVDRYAENEQTARQKSRCLHVYQDADGMVVVRGLLTPEVGAVLRRALDAARDRMYAKARVNDPEGDPPSLGQQQADALAMITEAALHHDLDPGAPGDRYQVVVHIDAPVLEDPDQAGQSALEDGQHVSAETSRRLACDASRIVMRHDPDGRITEVGARTRTIPPSLRRALQRRDQGCRFPGCGSRYTQGHHIRHWAQGGATTLSNLVLLCRRHHRSVHEDGLQVERLADEDVQFRRPNGWILPEVPESPDVPAMQPPC